MTTEWFNVKERLPEDGRWVLLIANISDADFELQCCMGFRLKGTWYGTEEEIELPIKPTHWLLLPPWPEEKK